MLKACQQENTSIMIIFNYYDKYFSNIKYQLSFYKRYIKQLTKGYCHLFIWIFGGPFMAGTQFIWDFNISHPEHMGESGMSE